MKKTIISVPKHITLKNVPSFISSIEPIFSLANQFKPNYTLDLSKVKQTNVLGLLLIYKIIEFGVKKHCFILPEITWDEYIDDKWHEYEFVPLINAYIKSESDEPKLKKMKIRISDKCIIAPQPLLRHSNFTEDYLRNNFLPKISQYYKDDYKTVSMIFTCFSEILLNFWEHAVEDTQSIMIADGNKDYIEIACADTGNGIVSSLSSIPEYGSLKKPDILRMSVERDVTSKKFSNHMGFGLWLINEIALAVKGNFSLFSEGAFYTNDRGKINYGQCAFWKGTVVYLALPLRNPKTIDDITSIHNKELDNIKINFA